MLKQAIIKDKKIVGALLLLVAAIATFVIACAVIFAQPTVEQSWASQQTPLEQKVDYQYLKNKLSPDNATTLYNFTEDQYTGKAETSVNPAEYSRQNLLDAISPNRVQAPDPIIAASSIDWAQTKTGINMLGTEVDANNLVTSMNNSHYDFRHNRELWKTAAQNYENWANRCQVGIVPLDRYTTQLYMVDGIGFDGTPALVYGESALAGGYAMELYDPVTQTSVLYRLTCGFQPIDVPVGQDNNIVVTPDLKIKIYDPVYQGNAERGGSYNWDFIHNVEDTSPGDFQTAQDVTRKGGTVIIYDGGGTSGGGTTGGGGSQPVNPDNPGQQKGPVIPTQPDKPGTKDGGEQGEFS